MKRLKLLASLLLATVAVLSLVAATASAAPVWDVKARWGDTHLPPGGTAQFTITLRNLGDTPSSGPITLVQQLPAGVTRVPPKPADTTAGNFHYESPGPWSCVGVAIVTCTSSEVIEPRGIALGSAGFGKSALMIRVAVAPDATGVSTNTITVSGGGAADPDLDVDQVSFSSDPAPFGFVSNTFQADLFDREHPAGDPERQAGTHPFELRLDFDVNLRKVEIAPEDLNPPLDPETRSSFIGTSPSGYLKTVETTLPVGFIGNPEATPKCNAANFFEGGGLIDDHITTDCPPDTQIGTMEVTVDRFGNDFYETPNLFKRVPVYNLEPPKGVPADFGFRIFNYRGHIYPSLDPAQGYAIKAAVPFIASVLPVRETQFTMWGVPGDPAHDHLRVDGRAPLTEAYGHPSKAPIRPLLSMPMDCSGSDTFKQTAESWQEPGKWLPRVESDLPLEVEGCDDLRVRFEPEIRLQPTSRAAGGPTGLDVHLEVPQRDQTVLDADELYAQNGDVNGIDTPPMKKAVVTFPEGMTLSTSAAQGLGVCSAAEIGIGTNDPVRCPENSRFGTLTLHTPILPKDEPMAGDIFIAKKGDNPFNNFLSMYFVIHDDSRGLLIKIPGKIDLDPKTGQIRTTFDDLPQFPVEDMQLTFKSGVRSALVNPTTCGKKTIRASFYSWHDPNTPHTVDSNYEITQKPDGSPCVNSLGERPFNPKFTAGTFNNNAGSYSPFIFRMERSDDDQEFSQLTTTLPPGLLANLSDVSECPEEGIAQAERPGRAGTAEQLFPSCPASSLLGSSDVGTGVGQVITYISGKAYLAGPYKGAPLSMVVITPILAGPYDLGVIAVRSAIHVNGEAGQATIATNPFPQIYEGIPVRLRDIRVKTDRPETTLNPTSCRPMAVTAHVTGTGGDLESTADDTAADLSERFQAANCASLGFKPRLSFRLKGGTKRGDYPALRAILRARPGDANIARTTVVLPKSTFVAQEHISTVCTRVSFAQRACPAGSIYGKARAVSPLFDETLEGPVFLRANGGERLLPDLVVLLNGKIEVVLTGFVDAVNERVRNTFNVIPDAPVTYFALQMKGGDRGLLVSSRNLCAVPSRASVRMLGHNGKTRNYRAKVGVRCQAKKKRKHEPQRDTRRR